MPAELTLEDYPDDAAQDTLEQILAALGGGAYAVRVDEALAGTYVGKAAVGSAAGAAAWQIQLLVETGPDLEVTWADGASSFDKVWTSRASYTYS